MPNTNLPSSADTDLDIGHCCHNPITALHRPFIALKRHIHKQTFQQRESTNRPQSTGVMNPSGSNTISDNVTQGIRSQASIESTIGSPPDLPPSPRSEEFLSKVKEKFPDDSQVYTASSQIISDLRRLSPGGRFEETLCTILGRAQILLNEHTDLIIGLNAFLPDGYCIEYQKTLALPRNTIHIYTHLPRSDPSFVAEGTNDSLVHLGPITSGFTSERPNPTKAGQTSRNCENAPSRLGPEVDPPEPILSVSEDFLDLIKLHFADTPEHYSQIFQTTEGLKSGRISGTEALARLVGLLWGCTYLLEYLKTSLPPSLSFEYATVFELQNVYQLFHSSTAPGTSKIHIQSGAHPNGIEDRPSGLSHSAQFFASDGRHTGQFYIQATTPKVEVKPTPSDKHVVVVFEGTKWLEGEHDGYPISRSWGEYFQRRRLIPLQTSLPSDPGNDALAQGWFTLGQLESVIEKKIPTQSVLERTPSGDLVISSRNLPAILRDWRRRMRAQRHLDEQTFRRWYDRVEIVLKDLLEFLVPETRFPQRSIFKGPDYLPNLLTIAAIGEVLMGSLAEFQNLMQPMAGYVWSVVLGRYPVQMLYEAGWCPFTVSMLLSSVCLVQYARICQPHLRRGPSHGIFDHKKCTRDMCSLNNIDPDVPYVNRHADDACQCQFARPPIDAVIGALARKEIPVVIISGQQSLPGTLSVRCMTSSQTRYVAISHVWADGLGSTTEDGLPTCQLRCISDLTRRLLPEEEGALWMDALCVPEVKEMRKQAIRLMAQTYRDAAYVLVIDAGIRSCSRDAPIEEKLLRILTCAWMQRLWTLQEALLAQNLMFEFADNHLVSLEELIPLDEKACTMDGLKWLLLRELAPIVIFTQDAPTEPVKHLLLSQRSFDLGTIGHALVKRSTSRKEDETLAIASLLGVEVSKLLEFASHEERMRTLLLELQFIPSGIIFSTGEKLTYPGFRWAPRSYLRQAFPNTDRRALCTPDGLAGKYPWFYFDETRFTSREIWLLHHADKKCYYLVEDGALDQNDYACDGVLLSSPMKTSHTSVPQSRNLVHAVAVKMDERRDICEFRRKLVFYLIGEHEVGQMQLQNKRLIDVRDAADPKIVFLT